MYIYSLYTMPIIPSTLPVHIILCKYMYVLTPTCTYILYTQCQPSPQYHLYVYCACTCTCSHLEAYAHIYSLLTMPIIPSYTCILIMIYRRIDTHCESYMQLSLNSIFINQMISCDIHVYTFSSNMVNGDRTTCIYMYKTQHRSEVWESRKYTRTHSHAHTHTHKHTHTHTHTLTLTRDDPWTIL